MERVLFIVGGMNIGGAETFLMKVFRALDKGKYSMDFAVANESEGVYDREIKELGGRIFHITPKTKGIVTNFDDIRRLVKKNKYRSVMRISQNSLSAIELIAARMGGAECIAFRSSNTNTCGSMLSQIMHYFFRWLPNITSNIRIAPSTEAAIFMFGKRAVKKGKVLFLHNAIDLTTFEYSVEKRNKIRRELCLSDSFVIGHVGRFSQQKNHEFLLEIFSEVKQTCNLAKLVLVGEGELEEQIRRKAVSLGVYESVIFTGARSDVADLLSAFDVFVFPSFFEGMPNSVIEAQANGLTCIVSSSITKEVNITDNVQFLPLSKDKEPWINAIKKCREDTVRVIDKQKFIDKGYDIHSEIERLVKLLF